LVAATDVEPVVVGKPSTGMLEAALDLLCTKPGETAMLGDRLDTDILGGIQTGMPTVLVLTGVQTLDDLKDTKIVPDLVVPTLEPLIRFYEARG